MGIVVKHNFVSPIVDGGDPTLVGPDEWNDSHSVSGAASVPETRVASGTITVSASTDDHILVDTGVATVNLPAASARASAVPLLIVDYGLDADTNTKTIVPNGSDTIRGLTSYTITSRGGTVELFPRPDGTGWYAREA